MTAAEDRARAEGELWRAEVELEYAAALAKKTREHAERLVREAEAFWASKQREPGFEFEPLEEEVCP